MLTTAELPPLSPVQECRQMRIFKQGTGILRSDRSTARIEAAPTTELTPKQRGLLLAGQASNDQQRLETVAKNIERRQMALLAE